MVEHVVIISRGDYEKVRDIIKAAIEDIDNIGNEESAAATMAKNRLESALRKLKGAQ